MFLKILQNSQEKIIAGVFSNEIVGQRPQAYNFIKKETPGQVEIFKILKNSFFTEQLPTTASGYIRILTAIKFNYQS